VAFRPFNPDASQWRAEKIATLKDASNKPQPITTGVRIEIDQNNNVDRYLFVGTGKLLDQQDLVDTSVINSFYVIRDGTWITPEPAPAVPYSRANLTAVLGTSVAGLNGVPTGRGWYQDGTDGSLKINSDVYADVNVAVYGFSSRRRIRVSVSCRRPFMPAISPPAIRCSWGAAGASLRVWTSWEASRASRSFRRIPGRALLRRPCWFRSRR
jgi:hypothetical protein